MPKISVVIPTYNQSKYLREAIDSVLAQTLPPFEIIICDDHSTDDSWKIITAYTQQFPTLIKAYRHSQNVGTARNFGSGLKMVQGDWVTLLAGDDRFLPRKLELEWKALQRQPGAQVAYSNVYIIDKDGKRTGIYHDDSLGPPPTGDVFVQVFSRSFFSNTRSLFRSQLTSRSVFRDIGGYDENLEIYEDWDFKIRLSSRYPVIYSGEALVEYRKHEGGLSSREPARNFRAHMKVYEKQLSLLDQRSRKEATWVRCNIERLLALQQIRLPLAERLSHYSAGSVYKRNRMLLDQLPEHDRMALEKKLAPLLTQLARRAVREQIEKNNRKLALKHWLEYLWYNPRDLDIRLTAQVVLPRWAYQQLKPAYRGLRSIRR